MARVVAPLAAQYCVGRGVDIGCGKWPVFGARAIEDHAEENAYDIKEEENTLDFVFSSHTLEHLERWKDALREWHRVLKPGGTLFLYLPHHACAMWEKGVNPQHLWTPTAQNVQDALRGLDMTIVHVTAQPDGFLSFVVVAQK